MKFYKAMDCYNVNKYSLAMQFGILITLNEDIIQ